MVLVELEEDSLLSLVSLVSFVFLGMTSLKSAVSSLPQT